MQKPCIDSLILEHQFGFTIKLKIMTEFDSYKPKEAPAEAGELSLREIRAMFKTFKDSVRTLVDYQNSTGPYRPPKYIVVQKDGETYEFGAVKMRKSGYGGKEMQYSFGIEKEAADEHFSLKLREKGRRLELWHTPPPVETVVYGTIIPRWHHVLIAHVSLDGEQEAATKLQEYLDTYLTMALTQMAQEDISAKTKKELDRLMSEL